MSSSDCRWGERDAKSSAAAQEFDVSGTASWIIELQLRKVALQLPVGSSFDTEVACARMDPAAMACGSRASLICLGG